MFLKFLDKIGRKKVVLDRGPSHPRYDEAKPWMNRYYVLFRYRPKWFPFNILIHEMLADDHGEGVHNHLCPYITIILRGGYWETTKKGKFWRKPGYIGFRSANAYHRVDLKEGTSPMTIFIPGPFGLRKGPRSEYGIDFKTKGVEGQNIYAIADGYVSRIKVSSYGYGKAVYINHPDGKTSVYAHLKQFSAKIDSIVKKEHYKREKFEINIFPKANSIMVKQAEIIALSGNSGSSQGAHLHFEIRDTKTEHPLDPLDFGFKVIDNISPIIKEIKIFDVNNSKLSSKHKIKKKNNQYYFEDTIYANEDIALGIYTYDQSNDAYNKNGVNKIKLFVDSVLICLLYTSPSPRD